jgi:hypothetical protein
MKNNFDIKKFLIENKVTRNSKIINEEFELGDEDLELAKGLNVKFLTQGDTIEPEMWGESFDPNFQDKSLYILNIDTDEDGEFITLQQQTGYEFDFDLHEINGYLKPEFRIEAEPIDESFELGDEDLKLAKQLNDEPEVQVDVHLIYNWNSDSKAFPSVPDHETTYRLHYSVDELVELIDKYSPYETYAADEIPSKLKDKAFIETLYESLIELAYEELGQPADLWSSHLIEEWIQDKAYKVFNPINWSKFPQDAWNLDEMEVTVDLIKPLNRVNEDFELGDEDLELAKDFNKRELKVGDYFYDSSNPEYAGAWTKLEDAPSRIRSLVKKIIYIGPNEGQYKELVYYDDEIVAFEFAMRPENVYTFTVDYFNKDLMNNINAYIPSKNDLEETFELGDEDLELAKGLDEENWTGETYEEFKEWAVPILIKANFELDNIKEYMLDMYDYGDMEPYLNITNKELIGDFDAYLENNINETFEMGPEDIGLTNGLKVIKYLEVGNQITPNMWNPNNPDLENFIDNRDENWTISMIEDNYVYLNTENGNEINIDIENINYLLKPEYMIEPNIYNR